MQGNRFFTGGKDKKIYMMDLYGNPMKLYEGHEGPVNSLMSPLANELVSGSWDG